MRTAQIAKSATVSHQFNWPYLGLLNKSEGFSPIDDLKVANSIPLKNEGFKDWISQVVMSNTTKTELFENSVLHNFRIDHEALHEAKQ